MPELPEVETVRRGLMSQVIGKTIERVEVLCDQDHSDAARDASVR